MWRTNGGKPEMTWSFGILQVLRSHKTVCQCSLPFCLRFVSLCLKVTELKKKTKPKIKGFCDQGGGLYHLLRRGESWHDYSDASVTHLWSSIFGFICVAGGRRTLVAQVHALAAYFWLCVGRSLQLPCSGCLGSSPPALVPSLWRRSLPGTWAASCCWFPAPSAWRAGDVGQSGDRLRAWSHCKTPRAPRWCWLRVGTQEPLHSCSPWLEDIGVAARVFFWRTLIFVL